MATEYKLSYTASDIDKKLGKIDTHESMITQLSSSKLNNSGHTGNKNIITDSSGNITTENKPVIPTKISQLTDDTIPDYIKTEADRVIKAIRSIQTPRTINIGTLTDWHVCSKGYNADNNTAKYNWEAAERAIQAMSFISKKIKLNTVVCLGDYINGDIILDTEGWLDVLGEFNEKLSDIQTKNLFKTYGNHDNGYGGSVYITKEQLYPYIASYNEELVSGNVVRGYGYKDIENLKLRMIVLNTAEYSSASDYTQNSSFKVNNEQYEWFANALDLSKKNNISDWQILIFSHHPLDWNGTTFINILKAYANGSSISVNNSTIDYNGKNSAVIIGNIHSHLHNMLTGTISGTSVHRWCCPNINHDYSNTYPNWKESDEIAMYHKKYPDNPELSKKKITSFVIYTINLDTGIVNRTHFGAGYSDFINYFDGNSGVIEPEPDEGNDDNTGGDSGGGDNSGDSGDNNENEQPVVHPDLEVIEGNLVATSVEYDGVTPYNDGHRFKNGYRLNSKGEEVKITNGNGFVTGFIKSDNISFAYPPDKLYANGVRWNNSYTSNCYVAFYDESRNILNNGTQYASINESAFRGVQDYISNNILTSEGNINGWKFANSWSLSIDFSSAKYIRISGAGDGSGIVVKINEQIE